MEQVLMLASWTAALYVLVTVAGWLVRPTATRVVPVGQHRRRRSLRRQVRMHGF